MSTSATSPGTLQRSHTRLEKQAEKELEDKSKNLKDVFRRNRWDIWVDFADTTTLHGPIHITTTKGKLRFYYIVVVFIMTAMFITHAIYLLLQYLSYPVLTELKFGNIDFTYPDVTICPNSPFTDQDIEDDNKLTASLESSEKFWFETNKVKFGSPKAHQKRSMLSHFYKQSATLGKKPYQHVLECQIKKEECLEDIIITEHPIYYRCFTLRPHTKPPVPSGPTNGIRIILHRGNLNSTPLLLVAEDEPPMLQSVNTIEAARLKDGFFIAFHEERTFPNFPVQSLPNGLSLRFGESVRIGLEEVHYEAVNLTGRKCINGDFAPQIELVRLDKLSESNAKSYEVAMNMVKFNYTRQACVAIHRQRLTFNRCKCFSEAYAIPYSMRDIGGVWCHNLETSTTNIIRIGETLECVEKIGALTDDEVVSLTQPFTPGDGLPGCPLRCNRRMISVHSALRTKLVQRLEPKVLIPYFEMLHLKRLDNNDNIFIKPNSPTIDPNDLIFLDIYPVSEMVNQIIENPGYAFVKFISDLGGISGLYVGITMYTLAELIDLLTQYLCLLLPYLYSRMRLMFLKKRNMNAWLQRRKEEEASDVTSVQESRGDFE